MTNLIAVARTTSAPRPLGRPGKRHMLAASRGNERVNSSGLLPELLRGATPFVPEACRPRTPAPGGGVGAMGGQDGAPPALLEGPGPVGPPPAPRSGPA